MDNSFQSNAANERSDEFSFRGGGDSPPFSLSLSFSPFSSFFSSYLCLGLAWLVLSYSVCVGRNLPRPLSSPSSFSSLFLSSPLFPSPSPTPLFHSLPTLPLTIGLSLCCAVLCYVMAWFCVLCYVEKTYPGFFKSTFFARKLSIVRYKIQDKTGHKTNCTPSRKACSCIIWISKISGLRLWLRLRIRDR